MDELQTKENLPILSDTKTVKALKDPASAHRGSLKEFNMSTSTPRKPLVNIKQVARSRDSVSSIKSSTPLVGTPRPSNSHRKMKPSSLMKKADKENMMVGNNKMRRSTGQCSLPHRMDEIFEENVEEFVTKVLDQCVQDIKNEESNFPDKDECIKELKQSSIESTVQCDHQSEGFNTPLEQHSEDFNKVSDQQSEDINLTSDQHSEDNIVPSDQQNEDFSSQSYNKDLIESEKIESLTGEVTRTVEKHELESPLGDLSVNEDSLLGNANCSDCSFAESSKSEEELLASFVQTPNLSKGTEVDKSVHRNEINEFENLETRHLGLKFQTPQPTFLEKLALRQRVNEATSSLATWVFPKEVTEHHINVVSGKEKVKHMHDMACSPMPHSRIMSLNKKFQNNQNMETRDNAVSVRDNDNLKIDNGINVLTKSSQSQTCSFERENINSCEDTQIDKVETNKTDAVTDIELGVAKDVDESFKSNYSTPCRKELCKNFASNTNIDAHLPVNSISMESIACSPISIPVCDFSVQNEVETQSVMCSPMRVENCDVSVQNEAEMRSMICSPIRFQGNDVSIQNEVELRTVMCSPMQLQVHDVSVQNQIDTHSIMCSPMVPCPSEDKYTFTIDAEVLEMGTMTEEKVSSELGVQIQPDVKAVGTEMEGNLMTTTSTCMTPLKMNKKKGLKMTAEDVRKQHPRVLANELETLRLENSRLETNVKALEKDRKRLNSQKEFNTKFEETKAALHELETKYSCDSDEWRTKHDLLEAEISLLKLEHESKARQESTVLDSKNESKAEGIRKLESDLHLKDEELQKQSKEQEVNLISIEQNKLAIQREQQQMAENKLVVQKENEQMAEEKVAIEKEKEQMAEDKLNIAKQREQMAENELAIQKEREQMAKNELAIQKEREQMAENELAIQKEREQMAEYKFDIQKEREQMTEIVSSCKENMLEVDSKFRETCAELEATKETVLTMNEEIDAITKEKKEVASNNEELSTKTATLQIEVDKMNEEIKGQNATINQLRDKIESQDESLKKRELLVKNLNRTLENRESEIDMLEKDLFECREIIYKQMETAKEKEVKEKEMTRELAALKTECDRLKDCCANLRAKEQEVRAILKSTEEELAGTQDYASKVMKKQGTEIVHCSSAIEELLENMTDVLANLSRRAGIENKDVEGSKVNIDSATVKTDSQTDNRNIHTSLVSQILNAANGLGDNIQNDAQSSSEKEEKQTGYVNTEKTDNSHQGRVEALSSSQEMVDSPGSLSRKKLGFSGNSAFAPVKKLITLQTTESENSNVSEGIVVKSSLTKLPEYKTTSHRLSSKVQSKFESVCHSSEEGELINQMSRVTKLFTEITRVAHLIEKALKSSLNDVTFENEDLSSRVSQCEYSERRLQAELQVTQTELDKSKNIVEQLNGKLYEMSEKFESMLDQELEIKNIQEEIFRLRGKNQGLEAENELLNEQIKELLEKLETNAAAGGHGGSAIDVESQRQVIALKKKVEKYRALLNEKDATVEQMSAKAVKRIQKLETNWKKADAEVCKFDELVDTVRAVLVGNKTVMEDQQLLKLIELIDGNEQVSAFDAERRQAVLKPKKTA